MVFYPPRPLSTSTEAWISYRTKSAAFVVQMWVDYNWYIDHSSSVCTCEQYLYIFILETKQKIEMLFRSGQKRKRTKYLCE